jgi:hypothetical protein
MIAEESVLGHGTNPLSREGGVEVGGFSGGVGDRVNRKA